MYGTIARVRVKQGMDGQLLAYNEAALGEAIPGIAFEHLYRSDSDPREVWMVVGFESREAYDANAAAPAQHDRYLRLRALLEADPEWHDGEIIQTATPAGI